MIQHSQQDAWNAIAKIWKGYRQKPWRDIEEDINFILKQQISKHFMQSQTSKHFMQSQTSKHFMQSQTSKHFMQSPKILDIGCGSGRNLLSFARARFDCYGIDFSKEMLKYGEQFAKQNKIKIKLKYGFAQKIPFPKNSFDYIMSIAVIHHLKKEDHLRALQEMFRVLKPGGIALITAWNHFNPKFWKFIFKKEPFVPWKINDVTYRRYYYFFSYWELKKLINQAGFKIIKSSSPFARNISFITKKTGGF